MEANNFGIRCLKCGGIQEYPLGDREAVEAWLSSPRADRPLVQDAFPTYSASEREMLISNRCGSCFDELFGKGAS